MKKLELTQEQAAWLRAILKYRVVARNYSREPRSDGDEHAESILAKIEKEIDQEKW